MAKFEKKIQAEILRRKGFSVGDIAKKLGVAKSSASIWCREIELSDPQKETLRINAIKSGNTGRLMGAEMNKQKRLVSLEKAREFAKENIKITPENESLLAGLCLYWAEGSKSMSSRLKFTNSDPKMMLFMMKWLEKNFDVKSRDLIPRISINNIHEPRQNKVLNFWSSTLNIPKEQFRKTTFIKTKLKKVYANHDNYYGILAIGVHKSTMIWYKILACIEEIRLSSV